MALVALMTVSASSAHADVSGPVWACKLSVHEIQGKGVYLGFGFTKLKGTGKLTCVSGIDVSNDKIGSKISTPVAVEMKTLGAGLGFKKVKTLHLVSAAFKVANPSNVFGDYQLVNLAPNITVLGTGLGASIGLELRHKGLKGIGFGANLQATDAAGLAATVDVLSSMKIKPIEE